MFLIEHCSHSAREKGSGVMAAGFVTSLSGSCLFLFVMFPTWISRCPVRRHGYVVLDCLLRVLADWRQWSRVRRRVYVRSDCRPADSADCVNWLVATHA